MPTKIGYLLPTRELVMEGKPEAAPLLDLAEKAEDLGFESIWAGDSLVARPRHEPLTLLAAVAARTKSSQIGTAVLLPALRNPVILAHLTATVDQISEGRLILGIGIAADVPNVRAEFAAAGVPWEKRVGRMMEGLRLCKALWSGEKVDWDGRWKLTNTSLDITPHQPGGPPLWCGGSAPGSLRRAGIHLDGWFLLGPNAESIGEGWTEVQKIGEKAGRNPDKLTCAAYLTVSIDDNSDKAEERLNTYLENYYGVPAVNMRKISACFAGPASNVRDWLLPFAENGATHIVVRFAGNQHTHMEKFANVCGSLDQK